MSAPPRDEPLRLALVGCGAAAERCHVAGLAWAPSVRLVAAVDPVPAHARGLVEAYASTGGDPADVRIMTSVAELGPDIAAAVVATPHRYHAEIAVELLRRGVHCLVEKPLALTLAECDAIAAAAAATGSLAGVAHVRRLFPASRWVKDLLQREALGAVGSISWREGAPYDWPLVSPSLFVPSLAGGGVLADAGPHVLDLIAWWLEPESPRIVAYRDSSRGGAESDATVELRLGEVAADVELSRTRLLSNTCRIVGSEAAVEVGIDVDAPYVVRRAKGEAPERGVVAAVPPAQPQWELLFAEQLRNFAAAIRGHEPVYADIAAGKRVVSLIASCYEARAPLHLPWNELQPL